MSDTPKIYWRNWNGRFLLKENGQICISDKCLWTLSSAQINFFEIGVNRSELQVQNRGTWNPWNEIFIHSKDWQMTDTFPVKKSLQRGWCIISLYGAHSGERIKVGGSIKKLFDNVRFRSYFDQILSLTQLNLLFT